MNIDWKWGADENKKGGDGFNNASILTFNSHAINSFIRELFQNSNDAKLSNAKKLRIAIEYKEIPYHEIPDREGYLKILRSVGERHKEPKKFFKKALEITNQMNIPFLVYSD